MVYYGGGPAAEAGEEAQRRPNRGDKVAVKMFSTLRKATAELFYHEAKIMSRFVLGLFISC